MAVRRNNPVAALVAPKLIRRGFKKLRRAADDARKHMSAVAYHEVRRRTKRLRYAIESFEGFYGDSAADFLQAIRRLQNSLGSHQDAHVAANRFRAMAGTRTYKMPGETVFLMGVFTERQRLTAGDMRQRFSKSYRRVQGRRWKALRRAMAELATTHSGAAVEKPPRSTGRQRERHHVVAWRKHSAQREMTSRRDDHELATVVTEPVAHGYRIGRGGQLRLPQLLARVEVIGAERGIGARTYKDRGPSR